MDKAWYLVDMGNPANEEALNRSFRRHDLVVEVWVPKFSTSKKLKKKVRPMQKPIFGTYAYICCEMSREIEDAVEEVSGCYVVPSASNNILPLSEEEMQQVRETAITYQKQGLGTIIQKEDKVEIISGSFAGYSAKVKAIIKERVIVEITVFDRSVPVTLKLSEISAI